MRPGPGALDGFSECSLRSTSDGDMSMSDIAGAPVKALSRGATTEDSSLVKTLPRGATTEDSPGNGGIFITRPTGGGGAISSPPLISETTRPILKIQAAFESPGQTVEAKQILLASGSRVTSQVRSK